MIESFDSKLGALKELVSDPKASMEGERDVRVLHDLAKDLVINLPADYCASFSTMSKPWSSLTSNSLLISCSNNSYSERYFFTAKDEELTALHRLTLSATNQPHTVRGGGSEDQAPSSLLQVLSSSASSSLKSHSRSLKVFQASLSPLQALSN